MEIWFWKYYNIVFYFYLFLRGCEISMGFFVFLSGDVFLRVSEIKWNVINFSFI